jgi:hypothetical protein
MVVLCHITVIEIPMEQIIIERAEPEKLLLEAVVCRQLFLQKLVVFRFFMFFEHLY